jgi:hypothetical protein
MQERKASWRSVFKRPHDNGYLASLIERHCRVEMVVLLRCPEDEGFACMKGVVRTGLADAESRILAVLFPAEWKLIFAGPGKTIGRVFLVPAIPRHVPGAPNLEDAWIVGAAHDPALALPTRMGEWSSSTSQWRRSLTFRESNHSTRQETPPCRNPSCHIDQRTQRLHALPDVSRGIKKSGIRTMLHEEARNGEEGEAGYQEARTASKQGHCFGFDGMSAFCNSLRRLKYTTSSPDSQKMFATVGASLSPFFSVPMRTAIPTF